MYTCNMCKKAVDGEAAFTNGAGSFCAECKAIIHARAADGVRARNAATKGLCPWCGENITQGKMQSGSGNDNVCKQCATRRDWLLKAIRYSDRPARYVARIEERERPIRDERMRAMQAAKRKVIDAADLPREKAATVQNDSEARLRRLELMINKITQAIEGIPF